MSTFPLNYDKRHWTIHSDLFILIIKTVVKTPFFYLQFTPLRHVLFLPRFHISSGVLAFVVFFAGSAKDRRLMGGSWGIFATSFESKNGEFGLVKGHDSQLCCESGGRICHEVYGFFRNSFCRNQNPFCCAVQRQSLRKHEVLLCFTGSDCHHVIKNRDRQRCWCIAKILSCTCANCWQVWQVHLWQPP